MNKEKTVILSYSFSGNLVEINGIRVNHFPIGFVCDMENDEDECSRELKKIVEETTVVVK